MKWPWQHRQKPRVPRPSVNPRRLELETAKKILAAFEEAVNLGAEKMEGEVTF